MIIERFLFIINTNTSANNRSSYIDDSCSAGMCFVQREQLQKEPGAHGLHRVVGRGPGGPELRERHQRREQPLLWGRGQRRESESAVRLRRPRAGRAELQSRWSSRLEVTEQNLNPCQINYHIISHVININLSLKRGRADEAGGGGRAGLV